MAQENQAIAQHDLTPLPFDSSLPTPTPIPLSEEAQVALQYVVEREGIPLDKLEVAGEESLPFPLLGRTYAYVTILHTQSNGTQIFSLLIDPITKAVEPDFNAVRHAEQAAHRAIYGKLEPALYERLQKISDDEVVLVAIWLVHTDVERSYEEIVSTIGTRYPEAAEAYAASGVLWAVDDPELSAVIQQEYERLVTENTDLRVQPVIDWLKAEGYEATSISSMPVVYTKLPKRTIIDASEREDVIRIYAFDGRVTPASSIATHTDRAPTVWNRGFNGNGIKVGIIELGNITGATAGCVTIAASRTGTATSDNHKNTVAAIAACNNTAKPGIASGVNIVDAGHNGTEVDVIEAMKWATAPTPSSQSFVVNQSEKIQTDRSLHLY